jgi:hypothetical protein
MLTPNGVGFQLIIVRGPPRASGAGKTGFTLFLWIFSNLNFWQNALTLRNGQN